MASTDYDPLLSEKDSVEIDDKLYCGDSSQKRTRKPTRWRLLAIGLAILCFLSVEMNVVLMIQRYNRSWELANELPTRFAKLRRDVSTEIITQSDYDSLNRTLQDAAWNDHRVEPWGGFVALDEDYATSHGLLHSQRWPWDTNKGVYVLTSAHELHCVRVLRHSVNQNHDGVPEHEQTWQYPHLLHCLNLLRESTMCNADDSPLFIGRLHGNVGSSHPRAGIGSRKMCRSWDKMLDWAHRHSACYRPVHWREEGFNEIDRYKFCPDGSTPWVQDNED